MSSLATHLEVVLEGLVSPQAADAWHAWGRGIPKEQVSWRGLLGAGEGQTDLWGCPVLQRMKKQNINQKIYDEGDSCCSHKGTFP